MTDKPILIHRFKENPLILPKNAPWLKWYPPFWRSVFNCGVIYDNETKLFKMLFRGGTRLFSNLGYAESADGINWKVAAKPVLKFYENFFWRGHTICGIEDPRIVKWAIRPVGLRLVEPGSNRGTPQIGIDEYYYIFATAGSIAYNIGTIWGSPRGSLGIWRTKDFKKFEWVNSPFSSEGKNAAIFNEPVIANEYVFDCRGQYAAILRRPQTRACIIFRKNSDIWLAQTPDLSLNGDWQNHEIVLFAAQVYKQNGERPTKIGLAGPPIKTPRGWLVIFHAKHGDGLSGKNFSYSLGFAVLDLKNPSKILYLHPEPILCPEKPEELNGYVKNVVFSCATVDKGDDYIYIYWGGADTVVCGGMLKKADLPMCY